MFRFNLAGWGDGGGYSDSDDSDSYDSEFEGFLNFLEDSARRSQRHHSGLISIMPDPYPTGDTPGPSSSSRASADDSSPMGIDIPQEEAKPVRSLLDMCSRVVARTYTCEDLENSDPPLDEALLKGVARWAFPQDEKQVRVFSNLTDKYNDWDRGLNLFKDNRIKEMWQVGFMASAHLSKYPTTGPAANKTSTDDNCEIRVSLTFEQQRIISSTCSECRAEIWCPHVLASIIYRIRKPAMVPVHAPMTEALSTLNRDQLQKLLQYAVQEDPAGILGRVFKYLDDVRDTSSDINSTPGAPDPTFGRAQGCKTQWQLSIEAMEKNLKMDLKEMVRDFSYARSSRTYYPNSYDLVEKKESKMFPYIKKVIDLARKKEVKSAANVLTRIVNCVLQKMESMTGMNECPPLNRFCHDLSRFYTLFMFTVKPYMRHYLYKSALDLQKRSHAVIQYKINNSNFAELPSIIPLLENKLDQSLRNGLFTEALCAHETEAVMQDLRELLDGKVSPEDSTYEEDLPIMMARLEAVNWLEVGSISSKMGHLATRIMYKVLSIIQKDSIIGAYLDTVGSTTPEAQAILNILKTGENCAPVSPVSVEAATMTVPGSSRPKRRATTKNTKPAKRQKKSHAPEELHPQMSRSQLTYSLLYLCHCMIQWQRKSSKRTNYEKQLIGFCLLALEMSRHRTATPQADISSSEGNWLLRLELSISDFLEQNAEHATDAVNMYIDALSAVGISFYNGCYPLVLVDVLLSLYMKNEKLKERVDDIVTLCAAFIQDSQNPLEKFTLPSSTPFDLILDTLTSGERPNRFERHHKDFAQRKFHTITETFLSQINTNKASHIELAQKVFQQFEHYESYNLLRRVTKELRFHLAKLDDQPQLLEGALKVLLHTLRRSETTYLMVRDSHRREDIDFIFSLVKKLGLPSLRLFISQWHNFFESRNLKELLMVLRDKIIECKVIPKEVIQLIMQYYESAGLHEDNACSLLSFYKPNDPNFKQASAAILKNSRNFTINSLFELAKLELAHSAKKNKAGDDLLNKEVFQIIECALLNLRNTTPAGITTETFTHLEWLCAKCTLGTQRDVTAKNSFLSRTINLLREYCGNHPGVLLHILQKLEKSPASYAKVASSLGEALVMAYSQHFVERFHECSHSAYGNVINEMRCAQLHCKQYVKDGDQLFETQVVSKVRTVHAGKKKLLRMLDVEFSTKQGANGSGAATAGSSKAK